MILCPNDFYISDCILIIIKNCKMMPAICQIKIITTSREVLQISACSDSGIKSTLTYDQ